MLVEIARGLSLKTVAEGVEDAEVAAWLRDQKLDMLQGYYFGKPSFERPWKDDKGAGTTGSEVKIQVPRTNANANAPSSIRVVSSF
jgi:EAL domain-containing protein (putative c-di-GMP-specific phosphodiesterase class I)